jgi:hypothetical protein
MSRSAQIKPSFENLVLAAQATRIILAKSTQKKSNPEIDGDAKRLRQFFNLRHHQIADHRSDRHLAKLMHHARTHQYRCDRLPH